MASKVWPPPRYVAEAHSDDEDGFAGGVSLQQQTIGVAAYGGFLPSRQPRGPPPDEGVQRHEGFARFIQKHSSPSHKRVTAGGKIVPAGPNPLPPTFHADFIEDVIQKSEAARRNQTSPSPNGPIKSAISGSQLTDSSKPKGVKDHKLAIPPYFKLIQTDAEGKSGYVASGNGVLKAKLKDNGETAFETMHPIERGQSSLPSAATANTAAVSYPQLLQAQPIPYLVPYHAMVPYFPGGSNAASIVPLMGPAGFAPFQMPQPALNEMMLAESLTQLKVQLDHCNRELRSTEKFQALNGDSMPVSERDQVNDKKRSLVERQSYLKTQVRQLEAVSTGCTTTLSSNAIVPCDQNMSGVHQMQPQALLFYDPNEVNQPTVGYAPQKSSQTIKSHGSEEKSSENKKKFSPNAPEFIPGIAGPVSNGEGHSSQPTGVTREPLDTPTPSPSKDDAPPSVRIPKVWASFYMSPRQSPTTDHAQINAMPWETDLSLPRPVTEGSAKARSPTEKPEDQRSKGLRVVWELLYAESAVTEAIKTFKEALESGDGLTFMKAKEALDKAYEDLRVLGEKSELIQTGIKIDTGTLPQDTVSQRSGQGSSIPENTSSPAELQVTSHTRDYEKSIGLLRDMMSENNLSHRTERVPTASLRQSGRVHVKPSRKSLHENDPQSSVPKSLDAQYQYKAQSSLAPPDIHASGNISRVHARSQEQLVQLRGGGMTDEGHYYGAESSQPSSSQRFADSESQGVQHGGVVGHSSHSELHSAQWASNTKTPTRSTERPLRHGQQQSYHQPNMAAMYKALQYGQDQSYHDRLSPVDSRRLGMTPSSMNRAPTTRSSTVRAHVRPEQPSMMRSNSAQYLTGAHNVIHPAQHHPMMQLEDRYGHSSYGVGGSHQTPQGINALRYGHAAATDRVLGGPSARVPYEQTHLPNARQNGSYRAPYLGNPFPAPPQANPFPTPPRTDRSASYVRRPGQDTAMRMSQLFAPAPHGYQPAMPSNYPRMG